MQIFQSVAVRSLSLSPSLSYFPYFCSVAVALYFHLLFCCELEPKISRSAYAKITRAGAIEREEWKRKQEKIANPAAGKTEATCVHA